MNDLSDLNELYSEMITDHDRHPRNFRELQGADRRADGHNPLCGDHLTVYLNLDGERITDVAFQGLGCAISRASASLMTDAVKGKTVTEAREMFDRFRAMITADVSAAVPGGVGKLAVFAGVRKFPLRVKCASLAWHALRAACDDLHEPVTTE